MAQILHVTECWGAGVRRAIEALVAATPDLSHHLLWEGDESPPDHGFASVTRLPAGIVQRSRAVRTVARRARADVIHAHSSWAGVYSRLLRPETPVVYQPHCYKFDDPTLSWSKAWVFRRAESMLSARTQAVLTLTDHERGLARRINPQVPTHHVANAPTLPPGSPQSELAAVVVMIGRISPQKDPSFFASVASLTRETRPDIEFVWVGDGDPTGRTRLENAGVRVTGWLDPDEIAATLEKAIYLHSAAYEGFPISVLDAAVRDCPIVARSISAFTGSPVTQVEDVASAAKMLLDVFSSRSEQRRLRALNREILRGSDPSTRAASIKSIYEHAARTA